MEFSEKLFAIVLGMGAIFIVVALFIIAWYIACSYAQYKVLEALGNRLAWMSWFPVLSLVALGSEARCSDGKARLLGVPVPVGLFSVWYFFYALVLLIPGVGVYLGRVFYALCLAESLKKVYSKCEGVEEGDVNVISYVSGFVPIFMYIKFMCYRKEEIARNVAILEKGHDSVTV